MINIKNQGEWILSLPVPGTQTIANDVACIVVPFSGVIRGILARLGTAGVTGTQVTDVLVAGTSIFSGGTKLNFASGSATPTYGALTTNPPAVTKGQIIKLNTTAINSGTAGVDLSVLINIRRSRESNSGMDTDSVSSGSDAL